MNLPGSRPAETAASIHPDSYRFGIARQRTDTARPFGEEKLSTE